MHVLAQSPPETFFMNIRTNVGMYSLHATALGQEVYSFEPLQINYERLCHSIQLNPGFEAQIVLFNVALTNKQEKVEFSGVTEKNIGRTSVHSITGNYPLGTEVIDYAQAVCLSDLQSVLPESGPVVLKVDVEDFECNALGGALDYLNKLDILYVSIEWSPLHLREC